MLPHGNGTLVCQSKFSGKLEYKPGEQTWVQIPDRFALKPAWLGWWNDDPPTEDDLRRKKTLPGNEVQLIDNTKWLVPRLRKYIDSDQMQLIYRTEVPTRLDYDAGGILTIGEVIPEYAAIWKQAMAVADALIGAAKDGDDLTEVELIEFAGPLLGINYHVSIFELVKLGILGHEESREIVRFALDMKGFEERLKNLLSRSRSTGTNTPSGSEPSSTDSPVVTDQPLPT